MANKATQTAGLTFNVNTVKNKLKESYESQGVTTPMFSGGHTSMAATLQKTCELILRECVKRVGKDKSGVRQVNRESLQYAVLLHSGFKQYFLVQLDHFDPTQMYKDQVPVAQAEMDQVLEGVDKDLSLTPRARNLLCFLLLKVFTDVAHTCSQMLEFSKKKSLDARCVMYGVSNRFPDSVASELRSEIVRVAKAFGDELEDNSGSPDSNEETAKPAEAPVAAAEPADEGDEVTAPAKGAKKGTKPAEKTETKTETKTASKGTKGKAAPKQVDVEDEEPAAEEPAEEAAEEPAAEVKPKKTAPATKTAPAKTGAKATKGK